MSHILGEVLFPIHISPTRLTTFKVRNDLFHWGGGRGYRMASIILSLICFLFSCDTSSGWGQVRLSTALPLPGIYDFDLYVADYESLSSLTRRTYYVTISDATTPLRVTIAWVDVPNIIWATKNLLNDMDLAVISPSGVVYYGNNLPGDDFNTMERVVVDPPELGEYKVQVTAKVLAVGSSQSYSIAITSMGSVNEKKTSVKSIKQSDIVTSTSCPTGQVSLKFQLEDWLEGSSWTDNNLYLVLEPSNEQGEDLYCEFTPNSDELKAEFTRTNQCVFCVLKGSSYYATLMNSTVGSASATPPREIRAVSPQCQAYISYYQRGVSLNINSDGTCNECPIGSALVDVKMYGNVTDDDESQYSW
jgi:hypothetical protein